MLSPCVALRFITRLYGLNGWSRSLNNTDNVDDSLRLAAAPRAGESHHPTQSLNLFCSA